MRTEKVTESERTEGLAMSQPLDVKMAMSTNSFPEIVIMGYVYHVSSSMFFHLQVNIFPGSGVITRKTDLASFGFNNSPIAFTLPHDKEKFLDHVSKHYSLGMTDPC
jgi:hypothetical protein